MRFKLKKNLFQVHEGYVLVNDEEIKEDDYYCTQQNYCESTYIIYVRITGLNGINPKKIIGTIGFKLDGIPYLDFPDIDVKFEKYIHNRRLCTAQEHNLIKMGWDAHSKKHKYTEKDIRRAIMLGFLDGIERKDDYKQVETSIMNKINNKIPELKELDVAEDFVYENHHHPTGYHIKRFNPPKLVTIPDLNHDGGKLVLKEYVLDIANI